MLLQIEMTGILAAKATYTNRFDREVIQLLVDDINRRCAQADHPLQKKKKRKIVITKYNAPKGVDFSESKGFYSSIEFLENVIEIPPHRDLNTHVKLRELLQCRVRSILKRMKRHNVIDLITFSSNALAHLKSLAIYTSETSTPKKMCDHSSKQNTPMSMPHRVTIMEDLVDVIKMRDRYFARARVYAGSFVDGPQRLVRSEAESDALALSEAVSKLRLGGEHADNRATWVHQIQTLASTLPSMRSVSTPQPDQRKSTTLPPNVFTTDNGQYFSSLSVLYESYQTPARVSIKEVLNDRAKCEAELKRIRALVSTSKSQNLNKQRDQILRAMERFVKSLVPETTAASLPQGVHRIRDKLFSTVDVLGHQLSTPVRNSTNEVISDMLTAESVLKELASCGNRDLVVTEIKQRWASADLMRTPTKISVSN